jgi:prepilin-type N-terminal cleavage/methylation domain-containing protein
MLINKMLTAKKTKSVQGFTLVECVIAMVVGLIGLLAIYSLIFLSVQIQAFSKDMSVANSLARAKIEELKNSSRAVGGSLTANNSGYYDSPSTKYYRRWQITDDAMGTQTIRVRVIHNASGPFMVEANLTTRMK